MDWYVSLVSACRIESRGLYYVVDDHGDIVENGK